MYSVYLLDDEPFILEGLKYIVPWEDYGFEIVGSASNGQDGLDEIVTKKIDLIITDIMMPKMTGLELISELKARNYDTNFIVLSAFQEFTYAKKAMNMGAENYLIKPIDTEELVKNLQDIHKKLKKKENDVIDSEMLRNNLLSKLISDVPSEDTLIRLSKLSLNFNRSEKCVAIVELKDKCEDFSKIIKGLTRNKPMSYCIESDSKAMIVIDEMDINLLIDELRTLKNELITLTGSIVYISTGKFVNGIDNLYVSHNTAKDMHDYKLVYPELSWIRTYKETSSKDEINYIDFENLKKILMNKNYSNTLEYVEDIFDKLKDEEGLTPKQIRMKSIEIFLTVYNFFNESKMMKGLNVYLENIININTVDEIESELINMIKYMQSKLENTEESISPVILKLLTHIEEKYKEDLNLKEISDKLNINSIYLGQLFQKETGILFSDYINNFRVNKAKQLLAETSLKASEIGDLVGYTNKNYFYRKFKDLVGITPSEWRKINL
ncbi:response regulator transcription factor [Romboutsia weinsteinii]|nr:response regulator transcription factor [Romboutsia weinsteinii]